MSKEQPLVAQPVAAGPTKVGEDWPKLVEFIGLVDWGAAAASETRAKQLTTASASMGIEIRMAGVLAFVLSNMPNLEPPLRIPACGRGVSDAAKKENAWQIYHTQ